MPYELPGERQWPRLENALADDYALRKAGIRQESEYFAPIVGRGDVQLDNTSYYRMRTGVSEQPEIVLFDGSEAVELDG